MYIAVFIVLLLAGCNNEYRPVDPIYTVTGEMLKNAESRCFGYGQVDYFLMQENRPDILVCNDGTVFPQTAWMPGHS